jgi:hypothetical protein
LEFALVIIININYVFIMAKQTTDTKLVVKNISRPGVHAKSKTSNLKSSKLYKKSYKGQGR